MSEATEDNSKIQQKSGEESEPEEPTVTRGKKSLTKSNNLREVSYMVLFIAAVFLINAMETGSYRTPWPVAVFTAVLGFGLLAYSFYHKSSDRG